MRLIRLTLAGLLCATAGCDFGFQDRTTVVDLRILGIQNEPAELNLDDAVAMATPISVRTLTVDPRPEHQAPVPWRVTICANGDVDSSAAAGPNTIFNGALVNRGTCPADAAVIATGVSPVEDIAFDFLTPAALLQQILDDPTLPLGVPAMLQLEVTPDAGPTETATKRMIYGRPITDATATPECDDHAWTPNRNPELPGLTLAHEIDDQGRPVDPRPFPAGAPYPVPLGSSIYVMPDSAAAQAELYRARYVDRATLKMKASCYQEVVRYSFYATAGNFAPRASSTMVNPALDEFHVHLESQYQAPREMPTKPVVRIWVVTRDERAGESWTERQLLLVAN